LPSCLKKKKKKNRKDVSNLRPRGKSRADAADPGKGKIGHPPRRGSTGGMHRGERPSDPAGVLIFLFYLRGVAIPIVGRKGFRKGEFINLFKKGLLERILDLAVKEGCLLFNVQEGGGRGGRRGLALTCWLIFNDLRKGAFIFFKKRERKRGGGIPETPSETDSVLE